MKDDDQNTIDLREKEAIDKIQELVGHNNICLFTTNLSEAPLNTRPMATLQVDDGGNLWFLSARDSDKNEDILVDPRVQLFYSNEGRAEFLSIYGQASIAYDKEKIEELWTPMAKAWFKVGIDDPMLTCIRVSPKEAFYWDTKNNRLVSVFKIMASAATGNTPNEGIKGNLRV